MGITFHTKLETLKYLPTTTMVQQMYERSSENCFERQWALMMSLETKLILDLAISSKSTTCDVSNILIRKDKHQQKAQEVNSYLKEQWKEIHIHYINHEKSLKPQHLNKLRLRLNKRVTSVLSSNFIREISNLFQCTLRSPSKEYDTFK